MKTPLYDGELEAELKSALSESGESDDIGDLMTVAARLQSEYRPTPPSLAGAARGRARLMAAVAEQPARRKAATAPSTGLLTTLQRRLSAGNPFGRLAMAGALAVVVLLMGNSVLTSSADSLPGDPLYGIKRAQEQVRYTFTLDETVREQLQEQFDNARAREVEALRKQMRTQRIEISGVVDAINGRNIIVDGLTLALPDSFDMTKLHVGDRIVVVVQTQSDGTIDFVEWRSSAPSSFLPSVAETSTATAQPRATARPTETPEPTRVRPPTEAPQPSPTLRPTEPPRPTATERPEPTKAPETTKAPEPTERPEASETPRSTTVTPEPTKASEATKAPEPTKAPESTKAPEPTKAPESTKAPEATREPESTREAEPTRSR